MSENLDFSNVSVGEGNKYLTPGIHKVVIKEMSTGRSTNKLSPYLRVTVEDENGASCTNDYYLNGGAFNISARNIVELVMATNNITEEQAKAKISGVNTDNIADKLAPVMVGKPFAIHINGEWVNPVDTNKSSFIKGIFGNHRNFALPVSRIGEMKHDDSKIKGSKMNNPTTSNVTNDGIVAQPKAATQW